MLFCLNKQKREIEQDEYYRVLAGQVCKFTEKGMRCFSITSSTEHQGKTDIILSLGKMLAHMGYKTLIIDAQLRQPTLSRKIKCYRSEGFVEIMENFKEGKDLSEIKSRALSYIQPTEYQNLDFYSRGGYLEKKYKEYIESKEIGMFLEAFKETYEVILIETCSLNYLSLTQSFLEEADGYFFTVKARSVPYHQAAELKNQLHKVKGNSLGAILFEEKQNFGLKILKRGKNGEENK